MGPQLPTAAGHTQIGRAVLLAVSGAGGAESSPPRSLLSQQTQDQQKSSRILGVLLLIIRTVPWVVLFGLDNEKTDKEEMQGHEDLSQLSQGRDRREDTFASSERADRQPWAQSVGSCWSQPHFHCGLSA